jgi:hypothetical protein
MNLFFNKLSVLSCRCYKEQWSCSTASLVSAIKPNPVTSRYFFSLYLNSPALQYKGGAKTHGIYEFLSSVQVCQRSSNSPWACVNARQLTNVAQPATLKLATTKTLLLRGAVCPVSICNAACYSAPTVKHTDLPAFILSKQRKTLRHLHKLCTKGKVITVQDSNTGLLQAKYITLIAPRTH